MKTLLLLLALALSGQPEFDTTIYDFGKIGVKDGPQSCTFNVTNTGSDDLLIYAVVSSCGCTNVDWTRSAIKPGEKGIISATYSNEDGPYPFDKTITVYMSSSDKPTVLHIRGEVTNKKKK